MPQFVEKVADSHFFKFWRSDIIGSAKVSKKLRYSGFNKTVVERRFIAKKNIVESPIIHG